MVWLFCILPLATPGGRRQLSFPSDPLSLHTLGLRGIVIVVSIAMKGDCM